MNHTSLNVKTHVFEIISLAASRYNVSISYIIKKIINKTIADFNCHAKQRILTEYQDHYPKKYWKCFHIAFSDEEVAANFRARMVYRISISKILLLGFVLFFEKIIEDLKGEKKQIIWFKYNYSSFLNTLYLSLQKSIKVRINTEKIIKEDSQT